MSRSSDVMPAALVSLLSYWEGKRNGRLMPARPDLNPAEMRAFLRHTLLLDVLQGPRFKVRLAGTHIVDTYGEEITGQFLDDLDLGDEKKSILDACSLCISHRKPHFFKGSLQKYLDGVKIDFSWIGLPLSTDGQNVNILMAGTVAKRLP